MTDTILEALNKLVEKSGGDPSDNKLIVDAINDLVETGGGSSNLVIETYDETTYNHNLNKTWKEIYDMMQTGAVFIKATDLDEGSAQTFFVGGTQIVSHQGETRYDVYATVFWDEGIDSTYTYYCQNENDYPFRE